MNPVCGCAEPGQSTTICVGCSGFHDQKRELDAEHRARVVELQRQHLEHHRAEVAERIAQAWAEDSVRPNYSLSDLLAECHEETHYTPTAGEQAILAKHPELAWFIRLPPASRVFYIDPNPLAMLLKRYPNISQEVWVYLLRVARLAEGASA